MNGISLDSLSNGLKSKIGSVNPTAVVLQFVFPHLRLAAAIDPWAAHKIFAGMDLLDVAVPVAHSFESLKAGSFRPVALIETLTLRGTIGCPVANLLERRALDVIGGKRIQGCLPESILGS